MDTVRFACYKIAPTFPLQRIGEFFQLEGISTRQNSIVLKGQHLNKILHRHVSRGQQVHLYDFGCITFVDFDEEDTWSFMAYLSSIVDKIDTKMAFQFYEHHSLETFDDNCRLWEGRTETVPFDSSVKRVIGLVLAKSAALSKVEVDTSRLLDEAEDLINRLRRGRLYTKKKQFALTIAKVLRFEYDTINAIRIFDTPNYLAENADMRGLYDEFARYYELYQRFENLENKIRELRRITGMYSELSHKTVETRLLVFEIFLLALFPLSHLIHYLLEK